MCLIEYRIKEVDWEAGKRVAKSVPEADIEAILAAVRGHEGGVSLGAIADALRLKLPNTTLQYRLKHLVDAGRLARTGKGRRTIKYNLPPLQPFETAGPPTTLIRAEGDVVIDLSPAATEIRRYVNQTLGARKPTGYRREFLDQYRPNVSFFLSAAERQLLAKIGSPGLPVEGAGTYAKQIFSRLLIDLSWNSSRLEGNTYSLLDTRRLIEFGQQAQGRDQSEAQMIVNHKDAIGFLVGSAEEIGFNRYTILNLHGILAHNLLPDEGAAGRLRRIEVGIEKSTFHPLGVPQLIEECFNQMLATASAIEDPFEQAFFIMVQLPYLQPFDDVNKRVSRLAANIPFIQHNLTPLSFIDVPRTLYTNAILGVYELNKVDLLKDVFLWAYKRSTEQYAAVRQSLGEPDPFRVKYEAARRKVISDVVGGRMSRPEAIAYIASWTDQNIEAAERDRFRDMAETELLNLHEGNFARYQIRPSEFAAWAKIWADRAGG